MISHAIELALQTLTITFLVMIVLSFGGRRSIAQLSLIHFVVIIAIGEAVLLPITEQNISILEFVFVVFCLVMFLILIEWVEMKLNFVERFISKEAVVLIKDGQLQIDKLKKNRMTVDALESQLRMAGVSNFEELKTATLEPTGQIGIEYKEAYQPVTVYDLYKALGRESELELAEVKGINQFDEITEGHKIPHDKRLK